MNRREFILRSSVFLGMLGAGSRVVPAEDSLRASRGLVRFGVVTDIHYADIPTTINRHYRESLEKLREGIDCFNRLKPDFLVQLGDFIDAADTVETEVLHLKRIDAEYARFTGPRHYVLGNHCVWSLTKDLYVENCGALKPHYSFDQNGFHFIILDACYRADGEPYGGKNFHWTDTEIPPEQREWLAADLNSTSMPTLVFVHQRLDTGAPYGVKSAPEVRDILSQSGKVLAVFQGHNHKNEHNEIRGVHYCTLQAVVEGSGPENNGYSVVDLFPDGIRISGFRRHQDHQWDT